ncbi:unknown [Anaerotruncus sp. CAG:390]|nr:unknown [Anaerotruncus sp. CAG:390]
MLFRKFAKLGPPAALFAGALSAAADEQIPARIAE